MSIIIVSISIWSTNLHFDSHEANLSSITRSVMTVAKLSASPGSHWWHAAGWECLKKGPRLFSCWPAYKNSIKPSVATYKSICNGQPDAPFHQSLPTVGPRLRFHLLVSTRNHLTLTPGDKWLHYTVLCHVSASTLNIAVQGTKL